MKLLLVLSAVMALSYAGEGDFSYLKQEEWGGVCNNPAATKQSPINIKQVHKTIYYKEGIKSFGSDVGVTRATTEGLQTVKFDITADNQPTIMMPKTWPVGTTKGLKALQLHFHWGKGGMGGSEHLLFDKQYAGQAHLVTRNLDQDDDKAEDYLSVFGIFLEESAEEDKIHKGMNDNLKELMKGETEIMKLDTWYDPETTSILNYEGGLTTPDCHTQVFWNVIEKPVTISTEVMKMLRDSADGKYEFNYREPQPMNGRHITNRVLRQSYDTDQNADTCEIDCMKAEYTCRARDQWSSGVALIPSLFLLSAALFCFA